MLTPGPPRMRYPATAVVMMTTNSMQMVDRTVARVAAATTLEHR